MALKSTRIQQQLLEVLQKIDRPASFCASGRLPQVLPGLEVMGVGSIALPLGRRQAAALKKLARQAPYGKGEQTLVDTDVRRVWEIDADQVTLANPEWPDVVRQAVKTVQSELGLEKQKLASHLYKLLLYEPGSFFAFHLDGEKLDRMVATLVIVLPSAHEGGELIVRHDGRQETIDLGGTESQFHTRFAAFYADCEHEILPVKKGFRLCLVYNLTLAKSKQRITAPTSGEHIEAACRVLGKWKTEESLQKLAIVLDHKYTKAGLAHDALKGVDRAKASVLFDAARQSGCEAHLALVTLWESGSAEPTGGYGRYARYRYDSDDYDDGDDGDHVMGELFDQSLTAENFSDSSGSRLSFGQVPLQEDEIVSEQPIGDGQPDKEDFEGYTGNAGMTLDRWYHRAAIVLWPAEARFDVLCEAGIESAVGGLGQMVNHWRKARKGQQASLKDQCLEFADRIILHWPSREFADRYVAAVEAEQASMLPLLESLGDAPLIAAWLRGVLAKDPSVDPGKSLGNVCQQHGWLTFQNELRSLFENTTNETIERNARLLADWCLRRDNNADRRKLCTALSQEMMSALERWDSQKTAHDWRAKQVNRSELLPPLMKSFIALDELKLLQRLVDHVLKVPEKYDITTIQMPALLSLQSWLKRKVKGACLPLHRWLTTIHEELESRASSPPQEPPDWRRKSAISCTCGDCQQLSRFLDDPTAETLRLPIAEQRRQHLHQIIDGNKLDLKHVTERRGRPYTLVCAKNTATYDRQLKAHRVDLDHLQTVQAMLHWHDGL